MIVYRATNKANGMKYVGVTSKPLKEREACHWCNRHKESYGRFVRALGEFGRAGFQWDILETFDDESQSANKEGTWIDNEDCCWPKGYNTNTRRIKHTEEERYQILKRICKNEL